MTALVIVVLAACGALVAWAFVRDDRYVRLVGGVLAVAWAAAIVATLFEGRADGDEQQVLVLFCLLLAVAGGAVVTSATFRTIDGERTAPGEEPRMQAAAAVLRGGTWIGALERVAVFGSLAARWPEGVAIVLAVKGLGRYPELRAGTSPGAAERFIIGTMVSVIWAAGCIYLAFAPYVVLLPGL